MKRSSVAATLLTAAGLGVLWFVGMLVPPVTRAILVDRPGRNLVLFVVIGTVLGALAKRVCARPLEPERAFLIATGFPLLGCIAFVWSITLLGWTSGTGDSPASLGEGVRTLLLLGFSSPATALWVGFYVIVPLGLITLYIMRWIAKSPETGDHEPAGSGA